MQAPSMPNPTMTGRDWSLLVALSVLWGGFFFFSEVALTELGPLTVVLGRVGLAALALIGFVTLTGHRLPSARGIWGAFLVMGALSNLIPVSALFLGVVVLGESPGAAAFAGLALIFAGLAAVDGRLLRSRRSRARPRPRPG